MAKDMNEMDFRNYGKGKEEFLPFEEGKVDAFVETSGGPVDPFGDNEAKKKGSPNMNAAGAFNKKDYTKIEAMGDDYPKQAKNQVEQHQDGDHFKTQEDHNIDPFGTDCGKKKSGQTSKRA